MPTERSKAMGERRARREGEEKGRADGKATAKLDEAARGAKPGWYDKKQIAAYFAVSVSYIEKRMQEGMPYARLGNRVRFKPAECEAWLEEHGHLERKGGA